MSQTSSRAKQGEHRYSVTEIDKMRDTVNAIISERYEGSAYMASERQAMVEDHLRTYMLNGTTQAELDDALVEVKERADASRKQRQEFYRQHWDRPHG